MRDSFIFYSSFVEALDELPADIQLQVYQAVSHYAIYGAEMELQGIAKAIFSLIKPQINANNKKYDDYQRDVENGKKGAEYGKLGGRPKKENPPQKPPQNPPGVFSENPINVNVNDNVNVNVEEEEKKEEEKTASASALNDFSEFSKTETQKTDGEFYGEYANVFLNKRHYDALRALILNDSILKQLIDELSEAIARPETKYKPYDSMYKDAHYLYLKAFWRQRYNAPEKFLQKTDGSTGGKKFLTSEERLAVIDKALNSSAGSVNSG